MRWNRYLDGGFGQVECSGQLAPAGPRHVVLPVELFLQPCNLLPGKGRAVSAHLVTGAAGQGALRAAAAAATVTLGGLAATGRTATQSIGAWRCTGAQSTQVHIQRHNTNTQTNADFRLEEGH